MNKKQLAELQSQIDLERQKCSDDLNYFINKYIKVVHPVRGLVPFELYKFQQDIIAKYQEQRFNFIKKFRQAGITTICAAYSLWYCLFKAEKSVLVVSIGDRESTAFLSRVWRMYDELPEFLKIGTDERNKHVVRFSNKSQIKSVPSSDSAGRGESVSLLIVDEAAFIDNMEVFWASIFPTISTGGEAIVLSTVNGMANWYYDTYKNAQKGANSFNVIDIYWQQHPDYTEEWAKATKKNIGPKRWLQEYECEFLGTGDTFIGGETLQVLRDNFNDNYETKYNNRMRVWKHPEAFKEYLIAADVGLGVDKDFSAFQVIDIYTGEQVAEFYSNKTSIKEYAEILAYEGELYNTAYCVPERNGIGIEFIRILFEDLEYENIWSQPDKKFQLGLQVTNQNRDAILATLEEYIRTNKIHVNSERTVKELTTFIVNKNNKIQAEEGYHDDLVMSLAIACYTFKDLIDTTPLEHSYGEYKDRKNISKNNPDNVFIHKVNNKDREVENLDWLYEPRHK
tara:strand:+ start:204 stop:1733 length:1530 start_codon:yes stop_codon:yes gene_type:complete